MPDRTNPTLHKIGWRIIRGFVKVTRMINARQSKLGESPISSVNVHRQKERFQLWASNIGIFEALKPPFDYSAGRNTSIDEFTRQILSEAHDHLLYLYEAFGGTLGKGDEYLIHEGMETGDEDKGDGSPNSTALGDRWHDEETADMSMFDQVGPEDTSQATRAVFADIVDIIDKLYLLAVRFDATTILGGEPGGSISETGETATDQEHSSGRSVERARASPTLLYQPQGLSSFQQQGVIDADIKHHLQEVVCNEGLEMFFAPEYIDQVAKMAGSLRDDPGNPVNSPEQLRGLATLALYQLVLYYDDTTYEYFIDIPIDSEDWFGKGVETRGQLVRRMADIATRAIPSQKHVHLFQIKRDTVFDTIIHDLHVLEALLDRAPEYTEAKPAGTVLRNKILSPLIYSGITSEKGLERPYLVWIITNSSPIMEPESAFRDSIIECRDALAKQGYRKDHVRFYISQIGVNRAAREFIDGLATDVQGLKTVHLATKEGEFEDNNIRYTSGYGKEFETWLLQQLLAPINQLKAE